MSVATTGIPSDSLAPSHNGKVAKSADLPFTSRSVMPPTIITRSYPESPTELAVTSG